MKTFKYLLVSLLLFLFGFNQAYAEDINTVMMQATCKIEAPGTLGTGFILGKPDPNNPPKAFYTLITAAHVLEAVQGDTIVLVLRQEQDDGNWKRIEVPVKIKVNGQPLWTKHPDVDAAAMFVHLPKNTIKSLLTTNFLMDDQSLDKYEIHPGEEILCLGYPFGAEANAEGFPILRSGRIASYPLTPTRMTKTFLFDFTVFRGNSGGPVYFVKENPSYGGGVYLGQTIQGILGIVIRERSITQKIQQLYERKETITPLQLAEVIHASFIKELIDLLSIPEK